MTATLRIIKFSRENDEAGGLVPYQVIQGPAPVYADINEEDYVAANGLFGGRLKEAFKGTILDKNERIRRRALREKTAAANLKVNAAASKQLGKPDSSDALIAAALKTTSPKTVSQTKGGLTTMQMGGIVAGIIVLIIVGVVVYKKKNGGK